MYYVPPINGNQADPDRPYINANPSTSTEGSIPPAEAIEHPMREIVAAIVLAGLTPDDGDLTQLGQAIQALATGGDMYKADNLTGLADYAAARANLGVLQRKGTTIASAATTNIGAADSHFISVSGNNIITSLGTGTDRDVVMVEFTGTPTLTHHATNLPLPNNANIVVEAGDKAIFARRGSAGSAQWDLISYLRKSGKALQAPEPVKYARLVHELAQGSSWVTYSARSWQTVPLNTEESDDDSIVTLASNQFTLPAGTYDIEALISIYSTGTVDPVARLYNVTDSVEVGRGLNDKNQSNVAMKGFGSHRWFFTIAAGKTFRIEIYPKSASTAQPTFNVSGFTERMNMVHIKKYL